jgi:glycosyltransferase involved in cell wall biosynthesis
MNIYYWSPFLTNVATEKAVINSIISVQKYSAKKINPHLIDVIGEWDKLKLDIKKNKINIKKLSKFKLIDYLPKYGFIKSRFSYIVIYFFSIFRLHKILKKEKPDFIILHLMTFIPLSLLLIFRYKTKFILRVSGFPKLNLLRTFFWRVVDKKIFIITAPTRKTVNFLAEKKIFQGSKIKFLPDPVINIKEIQEKKKIKNILEENISKYNTLISIGRLTKQKNFKFLIDCFYELQKKNFKLNLCIIGDGEERSNLEKQISKLKLNDKVFLLGYKQNIYSYLKNSKLFILTSLWEDPGFVLIEAGYMNKLILSSDCPNSPKELFEDESGGILFKSNSKKDFLDKYNLIENLDPKLIYKKNINFKKKIKLFTLPNHFRVLKSILLSNEN